MYILNPKYESSIDEIAYHIRIFYLQETPHINNILFYIRRDFLICNSAWLF